LFQQWGFPLSPVLNTHFHTLSACAQPILAEAGIKYFYSELAPDSVSRQPSPRYYPSGDPTLTTGQPGNPAIQQIYSGDSTSDCNQPSSLYDFMMHTDAVRTAGARVLDRLRLTLNSGFASFITTHEYLFRGLDRSFSESLWNAVNSTLDELTNSPVEKVSMSTLGDACREHTNVEIVSVTKKSTSCWTVELRGSSA